MRSYRRVELHNHSTESDGQLSVRELAEFMVSRGVKAFALTDHNTTSGRRKLEQLQKEIPGLECLYGMEVTSYFGHILCHGISGYVPWEDLSPRRPEVLFQRVKRLGGLAGIAHPFVPGAPVTNGCRWEMTLNDPAALDFLEIVNSSNPMEWNLPAVLWWESLAQAGTPVAAVAGLDFHEEKDFYDGAFTTFLAAEREMPLEQQFRECVRQGDTIVTRGPVFDVVSEDGGKRKCFLAAEEPVNHWKPQKPLTVRIALGGEIKQITWDHPEIPMELPLDASEPAAVSLYEGADFLASGPVIRHVGGFDLLSRIEINRNLLS